jgi:hypothetical protein
MKRLPVFCGVGNNVVIAYELQLTTNIGVPFRPSTYEMWGGQIDTVGDFSQFLRFPMSISFHQCSILIFTSILPLSEGPALKTWET